MYQKEYACDYHDLIDKARRELDGTDEKYKAFLDLVNEHLDFAFIVEEAKAVHFANTNFAAAHN